jgi:hypothetical protein
MHTYGIRTNVDISLVAGTAKTVLAWINGATRRCRLLTVQFGGASVTQADPPMLFEIVRFTTDGTGTAVTPTALEPANPAAIGTAKANYTVEPTTPTVVYEDRVSPIGNTFIWEVPPGREIYCAVSNLLALRLTALTNAQSNLRASMTVEE